jgi:hypothetical protein
MQPNAVTVSPDGYLLACVYSRDDSDMREEPEMYVWDLRPLVRDLLWSTRRHFVMFLVGSKLMPFSRTTVLETPKELVAFAESGVSVDSCVGRVFSSTDLVKYITQFL